MTGFIAAPPAGTYAGRSPWGSAAADSGAGGFLSGRRPEAGAGGGDGPGDCCDRCECWEPGGRAGAGQAGGPPGPRVLLAEDDADLRRLLAYVLRRAGYAVLEAADGPGALALARAARPDVAVLDGRLPGLGGPDVARALAADPATAGVRVILATGAPPSGALPAGVVAWLEKPFSRPALLAQVARALPVERPGGHRAGVVFWLRRKRSLGS